MRIYSSIFGFWSLIAQERFDTKKAKKYVPYEILFKVIPIVMEHR